MTDVRTRIGAGVRAALKARGHTTTELAHLIGRSRTQVSAKLNGKSSFTVDELAAISDWLGLPLDELRPGRVVDDKPAVLDWLTSAVVGLVRYAYEAGRADARRVEPTAEPDVMDRAETAAFLRCGLTKLRQITNRKVDPLPSFTIGGVPLYRRAEVEAWAARQSTADAMKAAA